MMRAGFASVDQTVGRLTAHRRKLDIIAGLILLFHMLCLPGLLLPVPISSQQAAANPCLCRILQTLTGSSGSVSCGGHCSFPWVLVCTRFCLCSPSLSGWYKVWVSLLLCPSSCLVAASPFVLGYGVYFFGGFQHSPVDGCSAACCDFGAFQREDKCTSFYSAILLEA